MVDGCRWGYTRAVAGGGGGENLAFCSLIPAGLEAWSAQRRASLLLSGSARYCLHKKQVKTAVGIISLILHYMP